MPSYLLGLFLSAGVFLATANMGFFCPSLAAAEPQVSTLVKQWQDLPDVDAEVAWQESPPDMLQGIWEALGGSTDQGENVSEFSPPKPIMVIETRGWHLSEDKEEIRVQPYFKVGRLRDAADDTQSWIFLLQKQSHPLVVHAQKDTSLVVVRQFDVTQPTGDLTEKARWVVSVRPVALPRPHARLDEPLPKRAADARDPLRQEPARDQPATEREEGTLAVEYLSPWNRPDAEKMLGLFKQHRWPAKRTINPGIMVSKVLPGASDELKVHDIIYRIGDVWLRSENEMREALALLRAGVPIEVRVKRLQPNSKGDPTWMTNEFILTPISKKEAIFAQQRESDRMRRVAEEQRRAGEEERRAAEKTRQERIAASLQGPAYNYDGRFPKSSFRVRLEEAVLKSDIPSLRLERQLKLVLSSSGLTLNELDWAEHVFKNEIPTGELSPDELVKYRAYLKLLARGSYY